jgi:hypothetical protein
MTGEHGSRFKITRHRIFGSSSVRKLALRGFSHHNFRVCAVQINQSLCHRVGLMPVYYEDSLPRDGRFWTAPVAVSKLPLGCSEPRPTVYQSLNGRLSAVRTVCHEPSSFKISSTSTTFMVFDVLLDAFLDTCDLGVNAHAAK